MTTYKTAFFCDVSDCGAYHHEDVGGCLIDDCSGNLIAGITYVCNNCKRMEAGPEVHLKKCDYCNKTMEKVEEE